MVDPDPGQPTLYKYNITHVFTPETNNSIHYWWFVSRDYRINDPEIDKLMVEAHAQAYYEDVEALEWINEVVRNDGEAQFDLSFAPDKPMRRNASTKKEPLRENSCMTSRLSISRI
jgi:hypothetical protein